MRTFLLSLLFLLVSTLAIGQETVQLRWNPSTDNVGVAGYNVWLNAEYYGTTSDTFFIITLPIGLHALAVSAFDAAGNESELSIALMVDIRDQESPSVPDSLMIVYPNPTFGGAFVVQFNKEINENTIFQILTTNGKIVYNEYLPPNPAYYKHRFEMGDELLPGLYVLALIEDGVRKGYTLLTVVGSAQPPRYASVRCVTDDGKVYKWSPFSEDLLAIWIP